jgi:FkbM family methyltransferase
MKYSQNNEEEYILRHFKGRTGNFLDCGAYNGIDLSNTRALMELGWDGICFEPNPDIFEKLAHNCMQFKNVLCYEMAIGEIDGTFEMQMNDTYYSTLKESEVQRWLNTDFKFKRHEVEVICFETFMKTSPIKTFNFISIDCEGVDYEVLKQIDLDKVECEMVCVETNGIETQKYIDYISKFNGFRVIHVNAENLIMAR